MLSTVGIRWGYGGEPEGLGWAWQPQNQPLTGNRVHQTRMNWRQVNNLLLPQVTNPSFPTTTVRNNPILLGLISAPFEPDHLPHFFRAIYPRYG